MYWILAPDTSSFSVYRHGLGDVLSVSGITAAQNGLHHNNPWLHLTSSPNLDLLEAQIQWVHAWCQRDFFLSRKKEFLGYCLNYTAPFLSHAILLDSYSPSSQWTPLTTNKKLLTFKFKIQAASSKLRWNHLHQRARYAIFSIYLTANFFFFNLLLPCPCNAKLPRCLPPSI